MPSLLELLSRDTEHPVVKLVVGLRGPPADPPLCRRAVGRDVLRELARRAGVETWRPHAQAELARVPVAGNEVLLVVPQMPTERTGEPVDGLSRRYKIGFGDVIVVHEDTTLAPGEIAVAKTGEGAGHAAVAAIVDRIGPELVRVRIGVGPPPAGTAEDEHLRGRFSAEERRALTEAIDRARDAVADAVTRGRR
jgi:PTH1 family peptidyl-tRNA hydrolase